MTHTEQANDLLSKIRAARLAFAKTGAAPTSRLQNHQIYPFYYEESDVISRFEAIWWSLQMAQNDVLAMVREWENEVGEAGQ